MPRATFDEQLAELEREVSITNIAEHVIYMATGKLEEINVG